MNQFKNYFKNENIDLILINHNLNNVDVNINNPIHNDIKINNINLIIPESFEEIIKFQTNFLYDLEELLSNIENYPLLNIDNFYLGKKIN
jgi:hypothetical protein